MRDQADRLRQLIDSLKRQTLNQEPVQQGAANKKAARVIAVTSGKGGVGKTNLVVNLALALSKLGMRVAILDADLGLANIEVLLSITPRYTLVDVMHGRKSMIEVLCSGPNNIKFISGGSGVEELTKLKEEQLRKFVENISLLDSISDIVLIDTGAGLSESVMSFVMGADEVLLVTTPEPTAIADGYAMIKFIFNRDPNKIIKMVVNKAENPAEAIDVLGRLCLVTEKFLQLKVYPLGYILEDDSVTRSVKMQQPFFLSFPKSQAARCIYEISQKLVKSDLREDVRPVSGIKSFVNRLANLLNM